MHLGPLLVDAGSQGVNLGLHLADQLHGRLFVESRSPRLPNAVRTRRSRLLPLLPLQLLFQLLLLVTPSLVGSRRALSVPLEAVLRFGKSLDVELRSHAHHPLALLLRFGQVLADFLGAARLKIGGQSVHLVEQLLPRHAKFDNQLLESSEVVLGVGVDTKRADVYLAVFAVELGLLFGVLDTLLVVIACSNFLDHFIMS